MIPNPEPNTRPEAAIIAIARKLILIDGEIASKITKIRCITTYSSIIIIRISVSLK